MKKIITLIVFIALIPIIAFSQNASKSFSNDSTYTSGFNDGFNKYTGYKGIATGTFVTSLLSPILGLAPAIGGSSGDPRVDFFTMPQNNQYKYGYIAGAKSIRNKKVWNNWVLGTVINVAITFVTVKMIQSSAKKDSGYKPPGF